jgi:hypothetical protein
MQRISLPNNYVHQETEVALRVSLRVDIVLVTFIECAVMHLGNQWHEIEVWNFLSYVLLM